MIGWLVNGFSITEFKLLLTLLCNEFIERLSLKWNSISVVFKGDNKGVEIDYHLICFDATQSFWTNQRNPFTSPTLWSTHTLVQHFQCQDQTKTSQKWTNHDDVIIALRRYRAIPRGGTRKVGLIGTQSCNRCARRAPSVVITGSLQAVTVIWPGNLIS